ncbi:hypothetical protein ACFQHV_06940 [Promicromonospora thailandica]|uniref:Uncharacterized protein n=1 Tax=Promicromonospora thailandica TaxID=765201 RepID=A0A9X2G3T7_9MICO|nr:hypothetical protein [Promicromonospora thailandica]MCP2266324.1 hypothetical protein [Promicromonospora thailandica]BFF19995.1 hypothetical protein GCM10025730_35160 [Promicromonospora thailandica]
MPGLGPLVERHATAARAAVATVTYGLLAVALVLGVLWFALPGEPRWEPAVNSLTLVAGVTGLVVERLSSEAERHAQVLAAVRRELERNRAVLADNEFARTAHGRPRAVFARLAVSAVDAALVSGVLDRRRDTALVTGLHRWRDTVQGFNRRLDLTENMTVLERQSAREREVWDAAMRLRGGYVATTREQLEDLLRALPVR